MEYRKGKSKLILEETKTIIYEGNDLDEGFDQVDELFDNWSSNSEIEILSIEDITVSRYDFRNGFNENSAISKKIRYIENKKASQHPETKSTRAIRR